MRTAAVICMWPAMFTGSRRCMRMCKQIICGFFASPSHSRIGFTWQACGRYSSKRNVKSCRNTAGACMWLHDGCATLAFATVFHLFFWFCFYFSFINIHMIFYCGDCLRILLPSLNDDKYVHSAVMWHGCKYVYLILYKLYV